MSRINQVGLAAIMAGGSYLMFNYLNKQNKIGDLGLFGNEKFLNARRIVDYQTKKATDQAYDLFYKYVHPDPDKREASRILADEFDKEINEMNASKELFLRIHSDIALGLTGDNKDMYENLMMAMEHNGAHLDVGANHLCKSYDEQLTELANTFNQNNTEAVAQVTLTDDEKTAMEGFLKNIGVTMESNTLDLKGYGLYMQIMKLCPVESVREKTYTAFFEPTEANVNILDEIQTLRDKKAKLMGYYNHAYCKLSNNALPTPEKVTSFLYNFQNEISKRIDKDTTTVTSALNIKEEDFVKVYNIAYYTNEYKKKFCGVDQMYYRNFFRLKPVLQKMLDVYREFFEIKFILIDEDYEPVPVWHDDVITFEVFNSEGNKLGMVHLDLYARDGKFAHPSNWPLIRRHEYLNGVVQTPVSALITSFNKGDEMHENGPLLMHSDVVTLFHEFGHSLHEMLNQSRYANIKGTLCERDIVEVPSMLLEYICWEPDIIKELSCDDNGKQLTDSDINKLVANKHNLASFGILKQIAYATFDQRYNSALCEAKTMPEHIYTDSRQTGPMVPLAGRFVHFVGYDAQYYTYLYSQSYAAVINKFIAGQPANHQKYLNYLRHTSNKELVNMVGENDPSVLTTELFQ